MNLTLKQFNVAFAVGCALMFSLACIVTAKGMLRVIYFSLSPACGAGSAKCGAAGLLVDYWWVLFVPLVLAAAYGLRKLYDRKRMELAGQPT